MRSIENNLCKANMLGYHYCLYKRSKIRLSVRPGQPKRSPDNQIYWCGCPTDNHKFSCPSCETLLHLLCFKDTDNQKFGRTTRNGNLLVRETTIYFSLIRTLVSTLLQLSTTQGTRFLSLHSGNNIFSLFFLQVSAITAMHALSALVALGEMIIAIVASAYCCAGVCTSATPSSQTTTVVSWYTCCVNVNGLQKHRS